MSISNEPLSSNRSINDPVLDKTLSVVSAVIKGMVVLSFPNSLGEAKLPRSKKGEATFNSIFALRLGKIKKGKKFFVSA